MAANDPFVLSVLLAENADLDWASEAFKAASKEMSPALREVEDHLNKLTEELEPITKQAPHCPEWNKKNIKALFLKNLLIKIEPHIKSRTINIPSKEQIKEYRERVIQEMSQKPIYIKPAVEQTSYQTSTFLPSSPPQPRYRTEEFIRNTINQGTSIFGFHPKTPTVYENLIKAAPEKQIFADETLNRSPAQLA